MWQLLIRDVFSTYDLRVIILHGSGNVSLVISLAKIFHQVYFIQKNGVIIENLYLFFNVKHKQLVICFTEKGIRIKAF